MADPESVEAAKEQAAQQAGDNHDLGMDGDDASNADREQGRPPEQDR